MEHAGDHIGGVHSVLKTVIGFDGEGVLGIRRRIRFRVLLDFLVLLRIPGGELMPPIEVGGGGCVEPCDCGRGEVEIAEDLIGLLFVERGISANVGFA